MGPYECASTLFLLVDFYSRRKIVFDKLLETKPKLLSEISTTTLGRRLATPPWEKAFLLFIYSPPYPKV